MIPAGAKNADRARWATIYLIRTGGIGGARRGPRAIAIRISGPERERADRGCGGVADEEHERPGKDAAEDGADLHQAREGAQVGHRVPAPGARPLFPVAGASAREFSRRARR